MVIYDATSAKLKTLEMKQNNVKHDGSLDTPSSPKLERRKKSGGRRRLTGGSGMGEWEDSEIIAMIGCEGGGGFGKYGGFGSKKTSDGWWGNSVQDPYSYGDIESWLVMNSLYYYFFLFFPIF